MSRRTLSLRGAVRTRNLRAGAAAVGSVTPDIDDFSYIRTKDMPNNMGYLEGLDFSPDGVFIYGPDFAAINQWKLATPWDITTAGNPFYQMIPLASRWWHNMDFNADGTRLYTYRGGGQSAELVYSKALSTPYDITSETGSWTESPTHTSDPVGGEDAILIPGTTEDFIFIDSSVSPNAKVTLYRTGTPGDITTLAKVGTVLDYSAVVNGGALSMDFNGDGTKFFIMTGDSDNKIYQYNLSVAYDLTTASYASKSLALRTTESVTQQGMFYRKDSDSIFIEVGNNNEFWVLEYGIV